MLLKIAWRNVWRKPTRSIVVVAAITLGLAAGVFTAALTVGFNEDRLQNALETYVNSLVVRAPGFKENYDVKLYLSRGSELADQLGNQPRILEVSRRIIGTGMLASPHAATGTRITGIHPDEEKQLRGLHTRLDTGSYFEGNRRLPILISRRTADRLRVGYKSKVVLNLQDVNGNLTSAAFKVTGVFSTESAGFDEQHSFVRASDLASVLSMPAGAYHELALLPEHPIQPDSAAATARQLAPEAEVQTWAEAAPDLAYAQEVSEQVMWIFMAIILFALMFGIVNTMLMSVLERIREFGVLSALGMQKWRIFGMIFLETLVMAFTGGILGMILGGLVVLYFSHAGLDLSAFSSALTLAGASSRIHLSLTWSFYLQLSGLIFLTALLSSIYPALKALRRRPAEALRAH